MAMDNILLLKRALILLIIPRFTATRLDPIG